MTETRGQARARRRLERLIEKQPQDVQAWCEISDENANLLGAQARDARSRGVRPEHLPIAPGSSSEDLWDGVDDRLSLPEEVRLRAQRRRIAYESVFDLLMVLHGVNPLDGHRPPSRRRAFARWKAGYRGHPDLGDERAARLVHDTLRDYRVAIDQVRVVRRHRGGESQHKLAQETGVSQPTISRWCASPEPGGEGGIDMSTIDREAFLQEVERRAERGALRGGRKGALDGVREALERHDAEQLVREAERLLEEAAE